MLFSDYIDGFQIFEGYLDITQQSQMLEACRRIIKTNPLWRPKFSGNGFVSDYALENTNCGQYGWLADETGFRYSKVDSFGNAWQPIPNEILAVVRQLTDANYKPENCLINFYRDTDKKSHLGLHVDRTEQNRTAPIISISLGQSCLFQIGGLERSDSVKEVVLKSGDVVVMDGLSRNAFHGVKCLIPKTTPIELGMKQESRINITIRQVY